MSTWSYRYLWFCVVGRLLRSLTAWSAAFSLLVNKPIRHFIYSEECHRKVLVASISLFINGDPYLDTGVSGGNLYFGNT
jgi:hypothetical protein